MPVSSSQRIGLIAGPVAFVAVWLLSLWLIPQAPADEWGDKTALVLGLVAWLAAWWLSEALPLAATSMLPLIILPTFGVMKAEDVAANYFHDMIALFLGGFCLAIAFERCGLHRRVATAILSRFGGGPRKLVLGFLVTSAILSMWVSNTSTALMLLPVGLTLIAAFQTSEGPPDPAAKRFGIALLLAIAWGASIGGLGTLIGTPPNAFLAGYWSDNYHTEIAAGKLPELTFGTWMRLGVPLVAVQIPLAWLLLTRVAIKVPARLEGVDIQEIIAEIRPTLVISRDEMLVAGVFALTVFGWLTRAPVDIAGFVIPLTGWGKGLGISDATISVAGGLILFALPSAEKGKGALLSWDVVKEKVPFDALALFGGGLALAAAFGASGLDNLVGAGFANIKGLNAGMIAIIVLVVVTVISEFASNTASAAMVIPVLAGIALSLGMGNPLPLLLAGCLGASCGFAMPVATPPNAIVFGSGKISVHRMVIAGLWMNAVAIATMWLALMFLAERVF